MARIDDKGLRQSLKNGEVANAYFVCGSEEYLKRTSVDLLLTKFADGGKDSFDFKKFDTSLTYCRTEYCPYTDTKPTV